MNKYKLFNGYKKQPFTKEELTNYIDTQINIFKNLNPILNNTYLIKIDCDKITSWFDYLASIDCFIENSYNLLSCPQMFIWPKYYNGKIQVYVLIQTQNERQNKKFLEKFAVDYIWPHAETKFKIQKINNLSVVIDKLLLFKSNINNHKGNKTNYIKDSNLIFNVFEYIETIEEAKKRLYKHLSKIKKFENKYKGVK